MASRSTTQILAICCLMTASSAVAGPLQGIQSIAAGPYHACATMANGQVQCWGMYTAFALGDGRKSNTRRATPAPVRTLHGATAVASGDHHSCAIENGGVRCWGGLINADVNVLGDGRAPPIYDYSIYAMNPSPTAANELDANIVSVSSNYHHTCAIRRITNMDSLWCWGGPNGSGLLGDGTRIDRNVPVRANGFSASSHIAAVATGDDFTCAVAGGGAWCWGANGSGQLGLGTTSGTHLTPEPVVGLSSGVSAIAAASDHACAIVSGNVMCWGRNNSSDVLGNGSTNNSKIPVAVVGLPAGVTAIAMGLSHTCALANGGVKCWGEKGSGKLGNECVLQAPLPCSTPVDVTGLTSGVIAISAPGHGNYTCAILQDHTARCWGNNAMGQLGNGINHGGSSSTPTTVVEADYIFYDSFGMTAD
ncbi:MAG: hypothetical protein KF903_09865 [Dokdonella sp.]|nr:hypothetical protein [Dokdonella sp.]